MLKYTAAVKKYNKKKHYSYNNYHRNHHPLSRYMTNTTIKAKSVKQSVI